MKAKTHKLFATLAIFFALVLSIAVLPISLAPLAGINDDESDTRLFLTVLLNCQETNVNEGATKTLVATVTPSTATVTWSSSNTSIASVNNNGVVSGINAKVSPVTITATASYSGETKTATCTVYVTVEDGIYYIQNQNSSLYLHVSSGLVENNTNVVQRTKYGSAVATETKITQIWKIKYLGSGKYSIRPLHKLDMGLHVSSGNVDISDIGTADTISGVQNDAKWTIERYPNNSSNYIIKNNGNSSKALHIINESTNNYASVIVGVNTSTLDYRWSLEKINTQYNGLLFYNSNTYSYVASSPTQYISPTYTRSLTQMGLIPAAFSNSTIDQSINWSSSDTSIVSVDSTSGEITGVAVGTATITGIKYLNGSPYYLSFDVEVIPLSDSYHGYAGVVTTTAYKGVSALIVLSKYYPFVADSGESVWVSTSVDSHGHWMQIGVRYYDGYSKYKLYVEHYDTETRELSILEDIGPDQMLFLKVEYSDTLNAWVASCNGVICGTGDLDTTLITMQSNGEVHKKYIQMGPFIISTLQFKDASGNWIDNTTTPTANSPYTYYGSNSYFTVSGPHY